MQEINVNRNKGKLFDSFHLHSLHFEWVWIPLPLMDTPISIDLESGPVTCRRTSNPLAHYCRCRYAVAQMACVPQVMGGVVGQCG